MMLLLYINTGIITAKRDGKSTYLILSLIKKAIG